ncbi:MAG TPA: hypothetical protein VJ955_03290 [Desulfuromonadales bacterium]|nr:hypothetical protein [Desulfuromonadales bacterium]
MMTSSTASPGSAASFSSRRITCAASSGAGTSARTPPSDPKGVRRPSTTKTSFMFDLHAGKNLCLHK